jgi:hypothetical protein
MGKAFPTVTPGCKERLHMGEGRAPDLGLGSSVELGQPFVPGVVWDVGGAGIEADSSFSWPWIEMIKLQAVS